MSTTGLPSQFVLFNEEQTKQPVLVVVIDGLDDVITNQGMGTYLLYGDPGVFYGGDGITYGGLRPYSKIDPTSGKLKTARQYLSLEGSSVTISQRLEPEQGKASISTISLSFLDDGYMTQVVSPGILLPEILGREVRLFFGYKEISYPQDYFEIFRGYISSVDDGPGIVKLQISDPNIKRRQQLFFIAQTTVLSPVGPSDATINVVNNGGFFTQIGGPDGSVKDNSIHTYIKIDNEWIECTPDPITPTVFHVVTSGRGARGTTAASHSIGATVSAGLQLGDSTYRENAMDMALKIMLSGWNGPWITGVKLLSIGPEPDLDPGTTTTDFILLPDQVDAVLDYGLVAGDYVGISGSGISGNNNIVPPLYQIVRFEDFNGQPNRIIHLNTPLTKEQNTTAVAQFRSQYDVYPVEAGLKLTPKDVDIDQHIYVKNTFLGGNGNDYIFFITQAEDSGKNFLESQIYFPVGAYSLTKRGKLSCGYHSPPIANQGIVTLDSTNIIDSQQTIPSRSLNNRTFFNEIDISYAFDDQGNAQAIANILDSDSYAAIGLINVLPIEAKGVYEGYSSDNLKKRALFLLTRYKTGALIIQTKVNMAAGAVLEAGDVVLLDDSEGVLQIANFNTGKRGLGKQLFEVIDRSLDFKSGNVQLKLVGGIGASAQDRFATISPSSMTDAGSTSTRVIIKDSFGAIFPGDESKKWEDYVGLPVTVHSPDYSVTADVTLVSIDPTNNYILNVTTLPFTPPAGYIVDVPQYPTSNDPTVNLLYKTIHAFLDPVVAVVSGVDSTHFTVGAGDIGKFHVGAPIRVHSIDYTNDSGDLTVIGISGTTIQTSASMGFTPSSGNQVDLVGFADFNAQSNAGQPYRFI